jgi:hypothetical protein
MDQQLSASCSDKFPPIKQWPPNVLRKLTQNISLNQRWNVALACKDLYEIIAFNDRFKYKILVNDEVSEND